MRWLNIGRHTAAWPVNNKLKLQDAFTAAYARYTGTHRLEDGTAIQGADKRLDLALVARQLDGIDLVGNVNDAAAENIGHALHFLALFAHSPYLDQHEFALDVRPFGQIDHFHHIDQ